jgi:hypothetical protein
MKVTYASDTLTLTTVFDLVAYSHRHYTVTPEHFDVTLNRFGLMSPIQCENGDYASDNASTIVGNDYVLSPSIDFYDLTTGEWTCVNIDQTDGGTKAWDLPWTTV